MALPMKQIVHWLEDIYNTLAAGLTIQAEDIEIGAVELKNATTDDRAKIATSGSVAEGDVVLGVQAPVLGVSTDPALDADGVGTIQQYLRGLLKEELRSNWPTRGTSQYLAISSTTAEITADLAIGNYILLADTSFTFAVTNSGGGGSAVSKTTPGIYWPGDVPFFLSLIAAKRVAAITASASGALMILPVS